MKKNSLLEKLQSVDNAARALDLLQREKSRVSASIQIVSDSKEKTITFSQTLTLDLNQLRFHSNGDEEFVTILSLLPDGDCRHTLDVPAIERRMFSEFLQIIESKGRSGVEFLKETFDKVGMSLIVKRKEIK